MIKYYLSRFVLTGLFVGIFMFAIYHIEKRKIISSRHFPGIVFIVLLILILVGFIERLDYTLQQGCTIFHEPVLETKNIFYSTVSFITISLAYIFGKVRKLLILIEIIFWMAKLLLIKGGYAMGIAATPNMLIFWYDLIGLSLRIWLLKFSFAKHGLQNIYIPVFAGIIIWIKSAFFT